MRVIGFVALSVALVLARPLARDIPSPSVSAGVVGPSSDALNAPSSSPAPSKVDARVEVTPPSASPDDWIMAYMKKFIEGWRPSHEEADSLAKTLEKMYIAVAAQHATWGFKEAFPKPMIDFMRAYVSAAKSR